MVNERLTETENQSRRTDRGDNVNDDKYLNDNGKFAGRKTWRSALPRRDGEVLPVLEECASRPVSRVLYGPCCHGRDSHSSGTPVAGRLSQPTRVTGLETGLDETARATPIRFCSRWGLPCRVRYRPRGGLLPHPFTLTPPFRHKACNRGGLLSVALSLGSPPPGVTRHRVSLEPGLSSTAAFRHLRQRLSGRLAPLP